MTITWFFASPAPVARHNFYGFPNDDFLRTQVDIGTVKFEHDFNEHVTLRDQFRYANYQRAGRITEPQVIYTGVTPNTPLSQILVNRNPISVFSTETFLDNQSDVTVRFNTGPVDAYRWSPGSNSGARPRLRRASGIPACRPPTC